jgi:hypothetical protein
MLTTALNFGAAVNKANSNVNYNAHKVSISSFMMNGRRVTFLTVRLDK